MQLSSLAGEKHSIYNGIPFTNISKIFVKKDAFFYGTEPFDRVYMHRPSRNKHTTSLSISLKWACRCTHALHCASAMLQKNRVQLTSESQSRQGRQSRWQLLGTFRHHQCEMEGWMAAGYTWGCRWRITSDGACHISEWLKRQRWII